MSDKDNAFAAPDTGHVWDDNLRELTNPPPRWWMWGLHASWIFVVIYSLLYPMWPMVNSHTKGLMGWTAIKEYKEDLGSVEAIRAPFEDKLEGMSAAQILADNELRNYTLASAKVLFGDNCAPCHGAGGQGNPGFPVLADDDWLYGGTIDRIVESIANGRRSVMPAHGSRLDTAQIQQLVSYVQSLSQGNPEAAGKDLYLSNGCIGCHGPEGKGNIFLGAANLSDGIWRFAGTPEAIAYTITHGVNDPGNQQTRNEVMPTFGGKLSATQINKLAVYVHQFGGGQ